MKNKAKKVAEKLEKKANQKSADLQETPDCLGVDKAIAKKSEGLLFEIPSFNPGKVHLVVGVDLVDACERLAVERRLAKYPDADKNSDNFRLRACDRLGTYFGRAHYAGLVGVPTKEPLGVLAINKVIEKAS